MAQNDHFWSPCARLIEIPNSVLVWKHHHMVVQLFKNKWYNLSPPMACWVNLNVNESGMSQVSMTDLGTKSSSVDSSASLCNPLWYFCMTWLLSRLSWIKKSKVHLPPIFMSRTSPNNLGWLWCSISTLTSSRRSFKYLIQDFRRIQIFIGLKLYTFLSFI